MDWPELADDVLGDGLDTFGEPAEYQPADGDLVSIASGGIFRETHKDIDPMSGVTVSSVSPTLDVRRSEIPKAPGAVVDGDRVVVRGRTWRVRDIQPDGETGARIHLHEVRA